MLSIFTRSGSVALIYRIGNLRGLHVLINRPLHLMSCSSVCKIKFSLLQLCEVFQMKQYASVIHGGESFLGSEIQSDINFQPVWKWKCWLSTKILLSDHTPLKIPTKNPPVSFLTFCQSHASTDFQELEFSPSETKETGGSQGQNLPLLCGCSSEDSSWTVDQFQGLVFLL